MRRLLLAGLAVALLAWARPARAQVTLRLATVAPDGSGWSKELRAFAQVVSRRTDGRVRVRWYWGGVAGTETAVAARIARHQLDGTASGGMMCSQVMPTMRVFRVVGTFQSRDEAAYVADRLRPQLISEARKAGFEMLGYSGLGPAVIFSRKPIRTMKELEVARFWAWGLDDVAAAVERRMGLTPVPLPLAEGAHAFEKGKIDAFYVIPSAALAFQWFSLAPNITDLRGDFLIGCVLITQRAVDRISPADRRALREEANRLAMRVDELGRRDDAALLGGVFARRGVRTIEVSRQFRAQFFDAARRARKGLPEEIVPGPLLRSVQRMLGDYRAEHAVAE